MPKNTVRKTQRRFARQKARGGIKKCTPLPAAMMGGGHSSVDGLEADESLWKLSWAMGTGRAPKKEYDGNRADTHVWLQHPETGDIIDPTPPEERFIGLTPHYKAWEGQSRLKCCLDWKKRWEQHLELEVVPSFQEIVGHQGPVTKEQIQNIGVAYLRNHEVEAQPNRCYYNILAIKNNHPGYKVQFGSMGYEVEPGRVFWEYG